jgi:hypothetical protein
LSSELDKLVEAVTDLVMAEIGQHAETPSPTSSRPRQNDKPGTRVLVCPGPKSVDSTCWSALAQSTLSPAVLVWSEFRADQLVGPCSRWKVEARCGHWDRVVSGYKAVILLGSDLSVLSGIGNLGHGACPPASAAVAAVAAGVPVFVENGHYESLRRHSSRLASGFVRRFEEFYRMVGSFGVELGASAQLPDFLSRLDSAAPAAPSDRSGGRAVVTVEDVEAVRRAGTRRLEIAMGTIVTPLASQRAAEWGIEVVIQ